jgi:hypothetical protein
MPSNTIAFSLADLYMAYKKAKAEAFYESTHYHALAFTEYEQKLEANLNRLLERLKDPDTAWWQDLAFIGDHAYLPKSIELPDEPQGSRHFRALDPLEDWKRHFKKSRVRVPARLRLVMRATVDFQIVSALWILQVGEIFDSAIDERLSFANRVRRDAAAIGKRGISQPQVNLRSHSLFTPYFSAYRSWRDKGLAAIESSLKSGKNVLAITMDLEQFYHRVAPRFLLRKQFLNAIDVALTPSQRRFTEMLLDAMSTWYESTPDYRERPEGGIPVGLSASKIIANVLLAPFDKLIAEKVTPIYYGRYVDDVFLVFENHEGLLDGDEVARYLAKKLSPYLRIPPREPRGIPSLHLHMPYAKDSDLVFSGSKQKIFSLDSIHGLDLVDHIREQIRIQSSEYRMLPAVPETGVEMAAKALLATPDATLQVDALRKADVVSVRRLGLSLLLRDIEIYASDLNAPSWSGIRQEFYGLVERHVLTPSGFFDFTVYIPRVFGLMVACRDVGNANSFIDKFLALVDVIRNTTTLGMASNRGRFDLCLAQYASALKQAALQSATERTSRVDIELLRVLRRLNEIHRDGSNFSNVDSLKRRVRQLLLADWGRRSYKDYWLLEQRRDEINPPVPESRAVQRLLRLGGIRQFRKLARGLMVPRWPALAFPTRPLRFDEIALVAPGVLTDPNLAARMVYVLRGAYMADEERMAIRRSDPPGGGANHLLVPGHEDQELVVAITSYLTTNRQWELAAKGRSDKSADRFSDLNRLVNRILQEKQRPRYILFPELSIPRSWALRIAKKLASMGISLIAGVEYYQDRLSGNLKNDCLISLTTRWPNYQSHVIIMQSKFLPAHGEKKNLRNLQLGNRSRLFRPPLQRPTVYQHNGFFFSVLVCSDLTNIDHRKDLRGEIDCLFILEWNQDVNTFSSLVESTASDLHAFITQVNNRQFGDSRVRSPAAKDYRRDIIQVKGGCSDFYVLGTIDYRTLRNEQRNRSLGPEFKPLPIGFRMSRARKIT